MKNPLKIVITALMLVVVLALFAGCEKEHEHSPEILSAVPATCTSTGLTEGSKCSECGEILVEQKETAKFEHEYENDYDATCNLCNAEREALISSEGLEFELLDNDTYAVIGIGTCTDTDIVIPETYEGKAITSIGDMAFVNCTDLTSVLMPDSVVSIGNASFGYCSSLTSINIPDSVTSIGMHTFMYCTSLPSVTISKNVASIDSFAFAMCTNLTSITADENNKYYKSIDGNLYSKDGTLLVQYAAGKKDADFLFPVSVTSIGVGAFIGCTSLTSLTTGDNIKDIGHSAFGYCSNLISVTIGDSVTTIGDYAFSCCTNLISATIGTNVLSIGSSAFAECPKFAEIYNKSSLDISNILQNVANIYTPDKGESMLYTDENGYIFFVAEVKVSLLGYAGTDTELVLPENCNGRGYQIFNYVFSSCKDIISVSIPDSVDSIGFAAFNDCTNLKSIVIGSGVEMIASSAFYNCTSLVSIQFGGTVAEWNAIQKGSGWDINLPATKVICSDGTVSLK